MKYIRTKDNVWQYDRNKNIVRPSEDGKSIAYWLNFDEKEIIQQADTIEELCDEFVFVGQDNMPILMETLQQCLDRIKDLGLVNYKIYGSIWIQLSSGSWGLKPVAKMNKKGEMELL